MGNKIIFFRMLVMVLVFGMVVAGCDNSLSDGTNEQKTGIAGIYVGIDGNTVFILKLDGDTGSGYSYELLISDTTCILTVRVSAGIVVAYNDGGVLILKPSNSTETFNATVSRTWESDVLAGVLTLAGTITLVRTIDSEGDATPSNDTLLAPVLLPPPNIVPVHLRGIWAGGNSTVTFTANTRTSPEITLLFFSVTNVNNENPVTQGTFPSGYHLGHGVVLTESVDSNIIFPGRSGISTGHLFLNNAKDAFLTSGNIFHKQ